MKPWARRRRRPRAPFGALMLVPGLVALGAPPAASPLNDRALTCFVGVEGRAVRVGEPVRDLQGREIGAVSAAQCAPDADRGRLRVQPNLYGADDARDAEGDIAGRGVRLALSADQLQDRTLLARAPSPRSQG